LKSFVINDIFIVTVFLGCHLEIDPFSYRP
jgi:hypothetical protein